MLAVSSRAISVTPLARPPAGDGDFGSAGKLDSSTNSSSRLQTFAILGGHCATKVGHGSNAPSSACELHRTSRDPDERRGSLTGKGRSDAQARVLDHLGIRYSKRPDKSLVVLRGSVERVLSATILKPREPELRL